MLSMICLRAQTVNVLHRIYGRLVGNFPDGLVLGSAEQIIELLWPQIEHELFRLRDLKSDKHVNAHRYSIRCSHVFHRRIEDDELLRDKAMHFTER